jgi:hypothetical protein
MATLSQPFRASQTGHSCAYDPNPHILCLLSFDVAVYSKWCGVSARSIVLATANPMGRVSAIDRADRKPGGLDKHCSQMI